MRRPLRGLRCSSESRPIQLTSSRTTIQCLADQARITSCRHTSKTRDHDLIYQYDFGDSWEHLISVIGRGDKLEFFFCVDGEGHGCAEDAGGPINWEDVRNACKGRSGDKDLREWYEKICVNGDRAGLKGDKVWRLDQDEINGHLVGLRKEH